MKLLPGANDLIREYSLYFAALLKNQAMELAFQKKIVLFQANVFRKPTAAYLVEGVNQEPRNLPWLLEGV